uniref:HAT C-terminal dimerisation domain-containing protein n=1 Tax=Sinocyclocheilus grahami TaxID=75366 RepID=A0A672K9I2_SINGR
LQDFIIEESLVPMAQHYGIRDDNLLAELHQMRRLLERKKEKGETVSSALELLFMLKPYKDSFADIYKLLRISVTLPVTSVSCERSFSCINLACLSIHAERTKALDVQKIVDSFALNHGNRGIYTLLE